MPGLRDLRKTEHSTGHYKTSTVYFTNKSQYALCCHVNVIMRVKDPYLSVIRLRQLTQMSHFYKIYNCRILTPNLVIYKPETCPVDKKESTYTKVRLISLREHN